jgi:hypothetical protein
VDRKRSAAVLTRVLKYVCEKLATTPRFAIFKSIFFHRQNAVSFSLAALDVFKPREA